jgi:hypothetical protein
MRICPHCYIEVPDNYDLCWNCQYSFTEEKVLDKSDFKVVCPKCGTEIEPSLYYCPSCHFDLKDINREMGVKADGPRHLSCLRCQVPMDYQGNFRFHEGTRIGALGNLFELFENRESFDLYTCSVCGKVEFFLPGFEEINKSGKPE